MDKKEARRAINEMKTIVNLGKNGITTTFLDTVDKYLKAHEVIKIKAMVAEDRVAVKYYADEIARETNSEVVIVKGTTFVLFREKEH